MNTVRGARCESAGPISFQSVQFIQHRTSGSEVTVCRIADPLWQMAEPIAKWHVHLLMQRKLMQRKRIGAASEMPGGTLKVKKAAMNVIASWNNSKAERFDALDRQIDQALGRLYGEIAAEPLSASLTALSRRLMLKDSHE